MVSFLSSTLFLPITLAACQQVLAREWRFKSSHPHQTSFKTRPSRFPRIENLNLRCGEIADVARNNGQIVMQRGCGEKPVDDRQDFAFSLSFRGEQAPSG